MASTSTGPTVVVNVPEPAIGAIEEAVGWLEANVADLEQAINAKLSTASPKEGFDFDDGLFVNSGSSPLYSRLRELNIRIITAAAAIRRTEL